MVHCVFQCWALIHGVETFSLWKLTISINTQSTWRLSLGKSRLSNVQYLEFKLVNERHKRSHTTTAHAFFSCIHHSNWQHRKACPPLVFFSSFGIFPSLSSLSLQLEGSRRTFLERFWNWCSILYTTLQEIALNS